MSKQTQLGFFEDKEIKPKAPPTPPKHDPVGENSLLYAKMGSLAVNGVQCEKYQEHSFDGTLATCLVMYRFDNSRIQINAPLCHEHAKQLIDWLAVPYSDTGLNSQSGDADEAK